MRIPVLIQGIGPCESAWIPRGGFKLIRIAGLIAGTIKVVSSCGAFVSRGNGEHEIPGQGDMVKVEHVDTYPVDVDLLR